MKSSLPFIKLTYLPCHCLPLILISHNWQLFLHHACECPIIPRITLAKTVADNFQNYLMAH